MTETHDLRYLYRRQADTGIWIQERGPFATEADALEEAVRLNLRVGICTSDDGRTVITEYPE